MPRHRDTLEQELAALRAAEIQRRREYTDFCAGMASLGPLAKVTAWLQYIADHRQADSDLESLTFLASRGHDLTAHATQVISEWKGSEKERIAEYNAGITVYNGNSGRARRRKKPPAITANDIAATSRVNLPDFWSGRDEQQLTIDATMLRATEWLRIGGFDHWWNRLARETAEDVVLGGGFEGMAGAFWLFGMCRSGYALKIMSAALNRSLDTISISRIKAPLPWQVQVPTRGRAKAVLSDHIPCASAIVFAEHRLHRTTGLGDEAIATIQRHYENGSWPVWTRESAPSIEATAMAMHALALVRPRGWEHMMAGASSWLLHVQHGDGYWVEAGTPDPIFLAVLVMDALNLATRPPVRWRSSIHRRSTMQNLNSRASASRSPFLARPGRESNLSPTSWRKTWTASRSSTITGTRLSWPDRISTRISSISITTAPTWLSWCFAPTTSTKTGATLNGAPSGT